ncbi:hypothetical protein EYF80_059618 [Liparis tanakae]|uniref:Uncharacterized protein n=1 Tax=Liparis tanakae TaxID=230148 RepID=A0A4Z2ENT9_9TELE|nr:hypothetical protein EYF80_059618 [Liparis tanakae]
MKLFAQQEKSFCRLARAGLEECQFHNTLFISSWALIPMSLSSSLLLSSSSSSPSSSLPERWLWKLLISPLMFSKYCWMQTLAKLLASMLKAQMKLFPSMRVTDTHTAGAMRDLCVMEQNM